MNNSKLPAEKGYLESQGVKRAFDFTPPGQIPTADNLPEDFKKALAHKLVIRDDRIKLSGDGVFYTVQGEGITTGLPAVFMRLQFCNLMCTWCFTGDTRVWLKEDWKNIEDIKVGDEVLSYKDARIVVSKVTNVSKRKADKIWGVTTNKMSLFCTPEHEFYVNKRLSKTNKRVVQAKDLTNKYIKYFYPFPNKITLDKKYQRGYLQGAYVGDGSYSPFAKEKRLYFQVCDKEFAEAILLCVNGLGSNSTITEAGRKTVKNKVVYRVTTARKETIETMLNELQTKEDIAGYIAGFYDAEGCLSRNQLILSQKDVSVLQRIKQMLLQFNVESSEIQKGTRADRLVINGKKNLYRFFQHIPVQITRKIYHDSRQQLEDVKVDISTEMIPDDPSVLVDVYDITTTIGNFFAEGFLVRNCDAFYTWNRDVEEFWKETEDITFEEGRRRLEEAWTCENRNIKRVVFTGGEPLMQKKQLDQLIALLPDWQIEFETNGTMMPTDEMIRLAMPNKVKFLGENLPRIQFNCSPKLQHSKNRTKLRIRGEVLKTLNGLNTTFKFVVMSPEDLDEIERDFIKPFDLDVNKVAVMPQGVSVEEIDMNLANVVEACKKKGYRLFTRLHVQIWGGAKRRV